MSYHCQDCDTPICGGCVAVGRHCGHKAVLAKDIVMQRKEKVGKKLDELRADVEPQLVKSIEDVESVTGQLTAQADQVRDEIRSATDKAVQMVKAVREQLLQEVTDIEEERCKLLDEQRDTLKRHLDSVRNAISFGDSLLQQGQRAVCLPQLVTLEERAVTLSDEKAALEPVRHAQLAFQCAEDSSLPEKAFQMTGKVLSYNGGAKHSTIEGNSEVRIDRDSEDMATFVLQVKDAHGAPAEKQCDKITTSWLKVPEGETSQATVTITDEGPSGQYRLSTRPSRLGKYELEVAVNGEALSRRLLVEVYDQMQFDVNECHREIQLSFNRRTATWTAGTSHKSVLGSVGMRSGRFSWKIKIGGIAHWHALGIAAKPLSNQGWNGDESHSWSSAQQKYGSLHDSSALSKWHSNDCIHFILDCDQHVLHMTNMRLNESHKITGLPDKEYFVYVNRCANGNSAEFVP